MEKGVQTNRTKKQAGVDDLISNKICFHPKLIIRDREGYFTCVKQKITSKF